MFATTTFNGSGLSDEQSRAMHRIGEQIAANLVRNQRLDTYYEGQNRVRDLGISIPPGLSRIETVVGWPTLAVDALEERLDIETWSVPDDSVDLDEVFTDNQLQLQTGLAHTDALIYGVEFVAVSVGGPGEPDVLVTIEPPTRMSGIWDARTQRMSAAGSVRFDDDGRPVSATLYEPDRSTFLARDGAAWSIIDVQQHNLGRVMVARLVNRPRSGQPWGTSQISRAVRSYTDTAVRTILGMEVAREFYSSPQRYVLGANEEAFVDQNGNPKTAWEVVLGRVLGLDRDEDGQLPEVGQFDAASPAPYLEQVKGLASLVAAEIGVPTSYMGFHTDNPPSADGVRALEARLVRAAERRQRSFGAGWSEVARLCLLLRDGELPENAGRISPVWRDASTPTRAATTDAAIKLVQEGILPANSEVTYEMLGFSETQKRRILADIRRQRLGSAIEMLAPAAVDATGDAEVAELAAQS